MESCNLSNSFLVVLEYWTSVTRDGSQIVCLGEITDKKMKISRGQDT